MKDKTFVTFSQLDRFLYYFIKERNVEKTLTMVTDDIRGVITRYQELVSNKDELRKALEKDINNWSQPINYVICEYYEKKIIDNIYNVFCIVKFSITQLEEDIDDEITVVPLHLSGIFDNTGEEYLAKSLHLSVDNNNENTNNENINDGNDFFPLRYAYGEKKLNKSSQHELIQLVSKIIPGGIMGGYVTEKFPVYIINDKLLEILDYTYESFMIETQGFLANILHPDDAEGIFNIIDDACVTSAQYEAEYRLRKGTGTYIWVHDTGRKIIVDNGRTAIISVVSDISQTISVREELIEETLRDPLTNLYNRKAAERMIGEYLEMNKTFIFIILDVDNFKCINDVHGHHMGDVVLVYLSECLQNSFRSTDIVARLGGDEIIIFISDDVSPIAIEQKLSTVSKKYAEKMKNICPSCHSSVSYGGIFGSGSYSFNAIYQYADKILYEIKSHHKGTINIKQLLPNEDIIVS